MTVYKCFLTCLMSLQKSSYDNKTICNHFMILQENVSELPL